MNDLTVIVFHVWTFWFLVLIGVLITIALALNFVRHLLPFWSGRQKGLPTIARRRTHE